jgi:hypothetical protein
MRSEREAAFKAVLHDHARSLETPNQLGCACAAPRAGHRLGREWRPAPVRQAQDTLYPVDSPAEVLRVETT